ncbi:hypothetical protein OY671_010995 [Metschnikowia pulcherrima]|nr:hypothetical protein OY671_010995 [Metschnikowia pulcherrima]
MRQVLRRRVPDREEQIMGWITQPYFEEGLEQGRAAGRTEGRAEGRAEGQARSLVRSSEKRFGTLPEPLRSEVLEADEQTSDAWSDRVFDAADSQAVFAEPLPVQS